MDQGSFFLDKKIYMSDGYVNLAILVVLNFVQGPIFSLEYLLVDAASF